MPLARSATAFSRGSALCHADAHTTFPEFRDILVAAEKFYEGVAAGHAATLTKQQFHNQVQLDRHVCSRTVCCNQTARKDSEPD